MEGIGERFGSSFDDVRRDPRPAVVALAFDLFAFGLLFLLVEIAVQGVPVPALHRAAVAQALPTFTDVVDPAATARDAAGLLQGAWVATALALALAPVAAYFEGGMVGLLKAAYVDRDPGPLAPRFEAAARRAFLPLLAYRVLLHGAVVAGFVAGALLPGRHNEVVGALVFEGLLVFTPFFVVLDGETAWGAMKRSVASVADHLATVLVMLLFALLVTGGVSALAREMRDFLGSWVLVPLGVLYAPIGVALSAFVLKVFLAMRPDDAEPAKAAPLSAPAGG